MKRLEAPTTLRELSGFVSSSDSLRALSGLGLYVTWVLHHIGLAPSIRHITLRRHQRTKNCSPSQPFCDLLVSSSFAWLVDDPEPTSCLCRLVSYVLVAPLFGRALMICLSEPHLRHRPLSRNYPGVRPSVAVPSCTCWARLPSL